MFVFWLIFFAESVGLSLCLNSQKEALAEPIYLLLALVNIIVFLAVSAKNGQFRTQKVQLFFCIAVVLRIAFLIWVQYFSDVFLLPNAGYDEYTFFYNAMRSIVRGSETKDTYSGVVTLIANFVGLSMFYLRFFNLLLSLHTITVFSKILNLLGFSDETYNRAMLFGCILPSYALISVLLLRESLIILMLTYSLYFFLKWWKSENLLYLFFGVLISYLATFLHSGSIVMAAGEILVFVFSKNINGERSFRLDKKRIIYLTIVMFVLLSLISVLGDSFGAESIDDVYAASENRIEGGSAYDANFIPIGGIPGVILNSPFHAIFFIGSPFPWQWRSASDIIAFSISAVFYIYVLYMTAKSIKERSRKIDLLNALLVIAIVAMIVFGWGVANAGTALRHRDKLVFVYVLMYALIFENELTSEEEVPTRREKIRERLRKLSNIFVKSSQIEKLETKQITTLVEPSREEHYEAPTLNLQFDEEKTEIEQIDGYIMPTLEEHYEPQTLNLSFDIEEQPKRDTQYVPLDTESESKEVNYFDDSWWTTE